MSQTGLLVGKMVHLALPVRWSLIEHNRRGVPEVACTYDIHPRGARLLSGREVNVGDLILVERGRNRAICQVVWKGDASSPLHGQFTVQCVEEGKAPWSEELKQIEERYHPLITGAIMARRGRGQEENRRRRPRFYVSGNADVIAGLQRTEGRVLQFSEFGARIVGESRLLPGTDLRLLLNILDVNLTLKAQVKYINEETGMGVEFQEIRLGDRPLLHYVLGRLRKSVDEFAKVEVVREMAHAV